MSIDTLNVGVLDTHVTIVVYVIWFGGIHPNAQIPQIDYQCLPTPIPDSTPVWIRLYSSVDTTLLQCGYDSTPAWIRPYSSVDTTLLQCGYDSTPAWIRLYSSVDTTLLQCGYDSTPAWIRA
ncbi:uncharacterized protein LOC121387275 [Gigantopelta aegis]|uniref:uncharacterized protein LOC121387275 n=1 Tax=Gigantopelta aegis TaxID=1735272 RepID=UPI001B887506|nr:uncharacterized protein LOC121387275 [Gigantopelta aegis]